MQTDYVPTPGELESIQAYRRMIADAEQQLSTVREELASYLRRIRMPHEIALRLQRGETVTVRGRYSTQKIFRLTLIEAELGVKFLKAHRGPSVMWNRSECQQWLSNVELIEAA